MGPALALVASKVGVPVQNIIYVERHERRLEPTFVPMKHGETLAIDLDARRHAVRRLDVHAAQIGLERRCGQIRVAPHEGQRPTHQFVEHRFFAHVAAVHEVRYAKGIEELDRT